MMHVRTMPCPQAKTCIRTDIHLCWLFSYLSLWRGPSLVPSLCVSFLLSPWVRQAQVDNPNFLLWRPVKDWVGGFSLLCTSEKETASFKALSSKWHQLSGTKSPLEFAPIPTAACIGGGQRVHEILSISRQRNNPYGCRIKASCQSQIDCTLSWWY